MTVSLLALGEARRFTRNIVRDVDLLRRPLVLKWMPNHREARAEERGWRALRKHYPVPRLYARLRLPTASLLIYQRWGNPTGPKIFLDLLNQGDEPALHEYLGILASSYRAVMLRTASHVTPSALVGKLYHDRATAGGRLDDYYADRAFDVGGVPIDELVDYTLLVNGRARRLDWRATLAWLREWAADPTPQWSAITQGDPTDVNLAVPFAPLDYDTAGRNAVCGEFANFCWYTGFLGGYLVPRTNPEAFKGAPETFELIPFNAPKVHAVTVDEDRRSLTVQLAWIPSGPRLAANRIYWHDVVEPVWERLVGSQDINRALRPYLALRILGVYNIADLEPMDTIALLACLAECLADDFDAHRLFTQGLS